MQAVAEAWRNLSAAGARPLAVTDCLNFGSPEHAHVMGAFAAAVEGIAEACAALDFPVVSGNVSFYNETEGSPIAPTPTIGGVGLIPDIATMARPGFVAEGESIVLVGDTEGHLGASLFAREIHGTEAGAPPPVDLGAERHNGDFVRAQIAAGRVRTCHDVADGGLAVAVAEMALAGGIGAEISTPEGDPHAFLFGEDQARYVLALPAAEVSPLIEDAANAGVPAAAIGRTVGNNLTLGGGRTISLAELCQANEGWLPAYMATGIWRAKRDKRRGDGCRRDRALDSRGHSRCRRGHRGLARRRRLLRPRTWCPSRLPAARPASSSTRWSTPTLEGKMGDASCTRSPCKPRHA